MVFDGYSGFLHYLKLASHKLATIGMNVTKNEIPNLQTPISILILHKFYDILLCRQAQLWVPLVYLGIILFVYILIF